MRIDHFLNFLTMSTLHIPNLILQLLDVFLIFLLSNFQRMLQLQYPIYFILNNLTFIFIPFTQHRMLIFQSIQLLLFCHYNCFQRFDLCCHLTILILALLYFQLGLFFVLSKLLLLIFCCCSRLEH